jgi:TM2 domain-containing membrane protein YozV
MQRSAQKRRRPVGAALLSLVSLGLGQIYNGELVKGILLKALMTAAIGLHALRLRMIGSLDLLFLGVLILIFLVLKAYSVGQAFRFAPQIKTAILPGCGHDLTVLQAGLVNRWILDFVKAP